MRTRQRLRRPVHEPLQAVTGIPAKSVMHRLASNPEPASHLGHRRARMNIQHGLIALFHDIELHEHDGPPTDL